MTKYSDPEFKVVLTSAQDVLTGSDAWETPSSGVVNFGGGVGTSVTSGAPLGCI